MDEKKFLTIVKDYLKENKIIFKDIPVNLKSINNEFLKVINDIIFTKNTTDDRI